MEFVGLLYRFGSYLHHEIEIDFLGPQVKMDNFLFVFVM